LDDLEPSVGYPSVEHAYQAAKSIEPGHRHRVLYAHSPGIAKRYGRTVIIRADWEQVKETVMLELLRQKFTHPDLRRRLIATGERTLIEGNTWGDTYWGVCAGQGHNRLGSLLMQVRREIGVDTL
jgi:ribA/ribD-fused uncharacterized protein